jgi:hypothetical protein
VLRRMEGAATKFVNTVDARRNLLMTGVAEGGR